MRYFYVILTGLLLIGAIFGIFWSAGRDFGTIQAVEFFPYDSTVELDNGEIIQSSGVVVRVNEYEAAPDDQSMGLLMISAREMYPLECSGDNWEVTVRRRNPDGGEEAYSYSHSIYNVTGSMTWVEYGRWIDDSYAVIDSYCADWREVTRVAHGESPFLVQVNGNIRDSAF